MTHDKLTLKALLGIIREAGGSELVSKELDDGGDQSLCISHCLVCGLTHYNPVMKCLEISGQ